MLSLTNLSISKAPTWIGKLTSLDCLNLCDNRLDALPIEFANLKKLEYLNLTGNNIDGFDMAQRDCINSDSWKLFKRAAVVFLQSTTANNSTLLNSTELIST